MWHCGSQCLCQWSCFKLQMEEILCTHKHKGASIEPIMVMGDSLTHTHTMDIWTYKHTHIHAYYYLNVAIGEASAVTEDFCRRRPGGVLEGDSSPCYRRPSWAEEATTSPASFFGESACIHGNSPSVTHIHAVQERQDEKQNVPGLKNMWG